MWLAPWVLISYKQELVQELARLLYTVGLYIVLRALVLITFFFFFFFFFFFLLFKGIHNRRQIKQEVDQMLEDLLLGDKGNIQASRLSGGMKRKLR